MPAVSATAERLESLRAEVRRIEGIGVAGESPVMPLGVAEVDSRIAGGGLAARALHEVTAKSPDVADDGSATLFLAGLAGRKSRLDGDGQVLWALTRRDLFAPGLAGAGLGPERLIHAECRNDEEVLAVMEEALRHGSLAAVIGEVGRCAMASARRLQLAAEEGGTLALMLRRWRKTGHDPIAEPSPAVTRWRIGCAPSERQPVPTVGRARWTVALVRQRGGEAHDWILEAPDAEARLALPALSADRPDQAGREERRAA